MSAQQTTLVVGGSRGIGAEFCRQIAQSHPSDKVIATVRSPQSFGIPNVETLELDINAADSIKGAATKVKRVDTLIVSAAIGKDEFLLTTSEEGFRDYLDTNVLGPLRVVKAFLPALRAGNAKKIILLSSYSGSLTKQKGAQWGQRGPYAVTKAALNMLAVQLDNELNSDGFTVVPIHPGWVATDMGNAFGKGAIPVDESVAGMLKVIESLKHDDSAKFLQYDGQEVPW